MSLTNTLLDVATNVQPYSATNSTNLFQKSTKTSQ